MEEGRQIHREEFKDTDIAKISGVLQQDFQESHVCRGEVFFSSVIAVLRNSGTVDHVPIIVSGDFLTSTKGEGKYVEVKGSIRTRDVEGEDGKQHLKVFVFVDKINITDDLGKLENPMNLNYVYLKALICNTPHLRKTPKGKTIADFIVMKQFAHKYFIPCICWSKMAYYSQNFSRHDEVTIEGRFQSRTYYKNDEAKETYELSVTHFL